MASAVTLSTRRRRDSSEDLGADSLGSIGGSAVGSSVEENPSISSSRQKKTTPILKPLEGLEVQPTASRGTGSAQASPSLLSRRPVKRRKGSVDFTLSTEEELSSGPLKKRKGSVDFSLALDDVQNVDDTRILPKLDALPSMEAINSLGSSVSPNVRGSASIGSSHTQGQAISALDYLDALGEEAGLAAAKVRVDGKLRKESMDSNGSGSQGTFASSGQRMLLDAFMSYGNESSTARRDRLESWGGMSDLSVTGVDNMSSSLVNPSTTTAAALASLANDVAAAANFGGACNESISSLLAGEDAKLASVPSKICLEKADDPSAALQLPAEGDLSSDLQAFVKKAMASVGNQLAELATAVESAAKPDGGVFEALPKDPEADSDMSSAASLMIGATSDAGSKIGSLEGRSRSLSITSALNISVDYDAVAAAVNAAEAAAGAFDLSAIVPPTSAKEMSSSSSVSSKSKRRRQLPTKKTRQASDVGQFSESMKQPASLPQHVDLPPVSKSKVEERDMEEIRERARAAAGYVPPSSATGTNLKPRPLPPKKRVKRPLQDPRTPDQHPSHVLSTPRVSNATTKSTPTAPVSSGTLLSSSKASASKGQSGQKWDSMFDCLLAFIAGRRIEETQGLSDKEKKEWIWDGNVPTTFKTKDGKALGRWVNNQRSAKSKGVLKEEREDRLVKAGLKWSVLASNSWNEMLEELRLYIAEQTKAGRKWDGNVPTNYRIKTTRNGGKINDEDKNLGRWVNRQRSLYQAGKLRSDRQNALEEVGLKWSMLATTSWESMFETLCDYVTAKTPENGEWDGNVPANYRTSDNPPRALGRWINRQRSAYVKDKLKPEYVEKLNSVGLKWSVHERRPTAPDVVSSSSNAKGKGDISNSSCQGEGKKVESGSNDERKGDAVPDDQPSNAEVDAAKRASGKEDNNTAIPVNPLNSAVDASANAVANAGQPAKEE